MDARAPVGRAGLRTRLTGLAGGASIVPLLLLFGFTAPREAVAEPEALE